MRIVMVSDTHLQRPPLPDGDVLIHAGDGLLRGLQSELRETAEWLGKQPHRIKIYVPGNHDLCLDPQYPFPSLANAQRAAECRSIFEAERIVFLCDSRAAYQHREGEWVHFYGAPWTPEFNNWGFMLPRGSEALRRKWDAIPEELDVLVTHGPPAHILDRTYSGESVGCEDLRAAVERAKPRIHVFGHVHEAYGVVAKPYTVFVNAAVCDSKCQARPVVLDAHADDDGRLVVERMLESKTRRVRK